jgi:2-polyprenyl-3-methyl-5-hydroxy-6-metoxy-1,4-benzoquinol methylase
MPPPTIEDRLKEIVLEALSLPYVSTSCKDSVVTGNHYQSVALGDVETAGFRSSRDEYLDQIAFRGKKVLDLGSNLGELSRAARARGAAIVDGIEYDPFFVEIANALNALNGTSRVSFYKGDITDRATYSELYDVVLAFSVSHYVYPVIDVLASVTRELLVVETHRLEDNLEEHYILPAARFLPAHRILGYSDWSASESAEHRRAVIAFARTEDQLDAALVEASSRRRANVGR